MNTTTFPETARKQAWFRQVAFRQAISAAIDRDAIVRLVYRGRATPLWGHVPPGNKLWIDRSVPHPARSLERARRLLETGGFSWRPEVDSLMRRQVSTLDSGARKRLYDRVQALVAQNLPLIFLVSPDVLVGANKALGNFRPAILDPHTLWNVEELFWRQKPDGGFP